MSYMRSEERQRHILEHAKRVFAERGFHAANVSHICAAAGIGHVWLYGGLGGGATNATTVAAAERHGLDTVAGHCPYMFLPGTPVFHRMHGVGKKLTGSYPKAG